MFSTNILQALMSKVNFFGQCDIKASDPFLYCLRKAIFHLDGLQFQLHIQVLHLKYQDRAKVEKREISMNLLQETCFQIISER